jgi:hypothetical protein
VKRLDFVYSRAYLDSTGSILQIDLCRLTLPQKKSFHFILQAVPEFNLVQNVVHNAKLEKCALKYDIAIFRRPMRTGDAIADSKQTELILI